MSNIMKNSEKLFKHKNVLFYFFLVELYPLFFFFFFYSFSVFFVLELAKISSDYFVNKSFVTTTAYC